MAKNPGYLYKVEHDKTEIYGLAYHAEQYPVFKEKQKVLVHLFLDKYCTQPAGPEGTDLKLLKPIDKLRLVGFSD